ncbi:hypothetical protein A1O1_08819 [Capronia coronata CBS 617.96]|uniref:Uncharacterized protein n=1 Tax=Capronia coronata CBS 617.96 TaxID=1182541 RepID=W9Y7Q2_9EURO|nr:uncharacterized protein A1O1_08819 [Capronia coronata CBS 617.96]EXJ78419.1 hypothetical protein A1O1_08819 [Capronia coronata CBS 617.96]
MATQWVLGKVSEALAPTVSGAVSGAGSFAGGAVSAVGSSINGVGEGINSSIRRYGDGVKDYGNAIMDWTRADAVRAPTANNPLGLSSGVTGGKRQVTSPQLYRAPATSSPSKTLMTTSRSAAPQKKIEAGMPRKALPAPGPKANGAMKKSTSAVPAPVQKHASTASAKSASAGAKISSTPNPGAMRKKPKETISEKTGPTKKPTAVKKSTPAKPNGTTAPKSAARSKVGGNSTAAANPLGLNF